MKKLFPILTILTALALIVCHRSEVGWISIQSTPEGAEVYLDDSLTNEVTNCVFEVEAGEHHLKLALEDYFDWEDSVTVEVDDTLKLDIELSNEVGYLDVTSEPQGAEVYVGINSTDEVTNCILEVPTGDHTVKLLMDDYKEWSKDVTVEVEDTVYLNAYLIPDTVQPGDVLWKYLFEASSRVSSPAIGLNGSIYFTKQENDAFYLYSLDLDGSLKWRFVLSEGYPSPPSVSSDGTVYAYCSKYIYAVNSDGSLKWKYQYSTSDYPFCAYFVISRPAINFAGSIFFLYQDSLIALSSSGNVLWKTGLEDDLSGGLAIGLDGSIYSCDTSGSLHKFNNDGSISWIYDPYANYHNGEKRNTSISIDDNGVVFYGYSWETVEWYDCNLHAVSSSGSQQWQVSRTGRAYFPPIIYSDGTLITRFEDGVYALSWGGNVKWFYPSASSDNMPVIGSNGYLFVGDIDKLIALSPSGNIVWETPVKVNGTPAINEEGVLYFGSDGYFYAVYTESDGLADSPWPRLWHDNQNTGNAAWPIR